MENDKEELSLQRQSYYRGIITGWLMKHKADFEEQTGIEVTEVLRILPEVKLED